MRRWLEKLFGIDKFRKGLETDQENYRRMIEEAEVFRHQYENQIKDLSGLMDILNKGKIGADVAFGNHSRSWAIVCLGTTKEAVYFYQFPDDKSTLRDINHFLRSVAVPAGMDRRNMTIDCPYGYDFRF